MAATQGPKTGTYIIDNPIVLAYAATTGPAMSAALRAVFRELARYADPMIGIARPTLEHLAGVLDLSRQTVAKDLRDLECLGLITIRQAEGFSGKRSEYYFPAAATGWRATPKDPTRPRTTLAAFRTRAAELLQEVRERDQRIWVLEESLAELTGEHVNSPGNGSDAGAPRYESPQVALLPEGSTTGPDNDKRSVGEQVAPNVKCSANIRLECDEESPPRRTTTAIGGKPPATVPSRRVASPPRPHWQPDGLENDTQTVAVLVSSLLQNRSRHCDSVVRTRFIRLNSPLTVACDTTASSRCPSVETRMWEHDGGTSPGFGLLAFRCRGWAAKAAGRPGRRVGGGRVLNNWTCLPHDLEPAARVDQRPVAADIALQRAPGGQMPNSRMEQATSRLADTFLFSRPG